MDMSRCRLVSWALVIVMNKREIFNKVCCFVSEEYHLQQKIKFDCNVSNFLAVVKCKSFFSPLCTFDTQNDRYPGLRFPEILNISIHYLAKHANFCFIGTWMAIIS